MKRVWNLFHGHGSDDFNLCETEIKEHSKQLDTLKVVGLLTSILSIKYQSDFKVRARGKSRFSFILPVDSRCHY